MLFISICIIAVALIVGLLIGQLYSEENWFVFTAAFLCFIFMGLLIAPDFVIVDSSTGKKVLSAEGSLFAGSLNHVSCLALLIGFWIEGPSQGKAIGGRQIGLALLIGIVTAVFSSGWLQVLVLIGIDHQEQGLVNILVNGSTDIKMWGIVFAVLLAPICEELLFRKLLLVLLLKNMEVVGAIIVSGVLFGMMHISSPTSVPPLIIFGFVLGWLQIKHRNILLPIIAHMTNNLIAAVVSLM